MNRALAMGTFACALMACRGQVVNLGSNDAGTPTVASEPASEFSATWTGYIEAYTLPSGSDAITIVLAAQSDGSLTGTVTLGDKPPPPPPTDPSIGYPPATQENPLTVASIEGFHYTAENVTLSMDGSRLQLDISTFELWKSWCALQTSYSWQTPSQPPPDSGLPPGSLIHVPPQAFGCSQGSSFSVETLSDGTMQCTVQEPSGADPNSIDCGKGAICAWPVCSCSMTSCTVDMSTTDVHFDLQLQGSSLDGAASTTGFNVCCPTIITPSQTTPPLDGHNIILTRSP